MYFIKYLHWLSEDQNAHFYLSNLGNHYHITLFALKIMYHHQVLLNSLNPIISTVAHFGNSISYNQSLCAKDN